MSLPDSPPPTCTSWSTTAANLPEHADNAIHTDAGARAAGFEAALVAGVTTYAYLTHVPATAWGRGWLEGGEATVRFRHPVLDGDRVRCSVDDERNEPSDGPVVVGADVGGHRRAEAEFLPTARPVVASGDGTALTPIEFVVDDTWCDYGMRAGDDCAIYAELDVAHPTSWPRIANRFCHEQLVRGPWIHVRSRIVHLGLASVGSTIRAEATVVDRFDSRAGERAVLDVRIAADDVAVAAIEHEAIIELAGT